MILSCSKRVRFSGSRELEILREEGNKTILVLTESKEYVEDISEKCLAELVNRVSITAKLFQVLQGEGLGFRILPCSGYYHDPGKGSCGLVYRYYPSTIPHSELMNTTLKMISTAVD